MVKIGEQDDCAPNWAGRCPMQALHSQSQKVSKAAIQQVWLDCQNHVVVVGDGCLK